VRHGRGQRSERSAPPAGEEQAAWQQALAEIRERIVDDDLAAASARGASMGYDEIVDYALTELDRLIAAGETTGR